MGDGGIIDWQKLKNFLTGRCHEVDHGLQVAEVAHAGTLLAAQGEYWHLRSGNLAVVEGEESLVQFIDDGIARLHLRKVDGAVHACFPEQQILLLVVSHKLELHVSGLQMSSIQIHHPFVIGVLCHLQHFFCIPCTQHVVGTYHSEAFAITKLRGTHDEAYGLGIVLHRQFFWSLVIDAIGEGTAVKISILRYHLPTVIVGELIRLGGVQFQTMLHEKPLGLEHPAIALYTIIIGVSLCWLFYTPVKRPSLAIESGHREPKFLILLLNVQDELLAEQGFVFYVKMNCHKTPFRS